MSTINEEAAWHILHQYAQDCLQIDSASLIAICATGSLAGGYYRPGQSDIDAVLIVTNGSRPIWGSSEQPSKALRELNRQYLERYEIPKDFGPFPLEESELFPPYDSGDDMLSLEIARLKVQGKPVYGQFDLNSVPMPTSKDFLAGARLFEKWWQDDFSKSNPPETMSPTACANTILMHLGRFLRIKKGILEFDKRKVVSIYLDGDPPLVNAEAFRLVEALLEGRSISRADRELLRGSMVQLRLQMNAHLGIDV